MDVNGTICEYVSICAVSACDMHDCKCVRNYIHANCNCISCMMYIGGNVSMSVCV